MMFEIETAYILLVPFTASINKRLSFSLWLPCKRRIKKVTMMTSREVI